MIEKKIKMKLENKTSTYKSFWSYCIVVSGLISIISLISYFVLFGLVFLLNLTSPVLNRIATILMVIIIVSFVVVIVIFFIREGKYFLKKVNEV